MRKPSPGLKQGSSLRNRGNSGSIYLSQLNVARRDIRLLTILPGLESDDLKCTLRTVSLHENTAYEALSYYWGDASAQKSVIVDRKTISVSVTLEIALRHLRFEHESRTIRAEAICISQKAPEERDQQVPQMRYVY
jgi:hypothetical protein